MDRKMKLRYRAALPLMLSAVLSCMPAAAFSMNGNNAVSVKAEESGKRSAGGNKTDQETEESAGEQAENGTDPACTCEDKCGAYEYDHNCKACGKDYKLCAYKKPNVSISINKPDGWFHDSAAVTFKAADMAHTGNFGLAKMRAKIGQNGSWTDVTEDKKLDISENCTVYVEVTDQKGNTYERNRAVRCFDTTKPTLNAAVSDGLLSVQVQDADSGAESVYVNGYKFTKLAKGTLHVRLQQFDAGYEYFTISAMDHAGNMSEVYKTKNPYYKDPADEGDENPAGQLPASAEATESGNAAGTVTEHTKTDSGGNAVSQASKEQKKQESAQAKSGNKETSEQGKEFYTIQTASGKEFYLIIDRDGEEEMAYFLTEITENDLLNTTSGNSETLPKNSAALESAIPTEESALPNNNGEMPEDAGQAEETSKDAENTEDAEGTEEPEPEEKAAGPAESDPAVSYILMGALAIAFIGGAYYFKTARRKKEDFIEDEDEDEEDKEEYENEDEEPDDSSGDDFFDGKEDE